MEQYNEVYELTFKTQIARQLLGQNFKIMRSALTK